MNGLDGIETAEIIRKYDVSTLIIFITNYDNYAKKAFEVAAFRFIDKPIEKELFGDDHTGFYNFWCWDEGARQFVMVDGFEALELMWFDPDTKTVYGRLEGYFQRENEKFTLYEEQN